MDHTQLPDSLWTYLESRGEEPVTAARCDDHSRAVGIGCRVCNHNHKRSVRKDLRNHNGSL